MPNKITKFKDCKKLFSTLKDYDEVHKILKNRHSK
jgi:hypothetical protein